MPRRPLDEVQASLQALRAVGRVEALAELAACCRDYVDAWEENPTGEENNVDLRAGTLQAALLFLHEANARS